MDTLPTTVLAAHEIADMKELFLQLLHNYPDGAISVIDRRYNFLYTGGDLHKRLNARQSEIVGKKMYPKFPEKLRRVIKVCLKDVFAGNSISGFEFPCQLKNNYYSMDAFPLRSFNGNISNVGVIIRNVSAAKKNEQELLQNLEREKELNHLKSKFVATASHEFRTPLSTILASTELLEMYLSRNEPEKCNKHIDRIKASINNLKSILEDFLALDKIEQGKMLPSAEVFNIGEFTLEMADELMQTFKAGQKIFCNHSGDTNIYLDKKILHNILQNLLSNSSKYSPEGSQIELITKVQPSEITISVQDHGIGIPKFEQEQIFTRFF